VALAGAIAAGAALVTAIALTLAAAGLVLAAGGVYIAGRGRATAEKASSDLDFLARRLLRVESRLADAERRAKTGGDGDLRGAVAEVSGEIALISGLLRDLAGTVAAHDRTLAEREEAPAPRLAARAAPAEPPAYEESHYEEAETEEDAYEDAPYAETDHDDPPPAYREPAYREPPLPARAAAQPRFAPIVEPDPEPAPPPRRNQPFTPEPFAPEPLFEEEVAPVDPALERRAAAIARALREDRIEIHLQPIVSLPQRKTRFYEALARLRLDDEELLLPAEFLPALERAGLTAELDGKVAARAAAIARHLVTRGSDAFVTANLAHESLSAPGFLRALGRIIEAYPDVAGRLAFEIAQRSWRMLDAEVAGALEALRAKGALFVMDRATDLRLDAFGLADRGVRFVKLPAALLLSHLGARAPGLDIAVGDLAAVLARAGIRLVADAVEREEDVPDLIDLDVPLGQGLVFGAPRAVRADLIGGPPGRGGGGAEPPARPAPAAGGDAVTAKAREGGRPPSGGSSAASAVRKREPDPPLPPRPEPRIPYRATLRRAG